MVKSAKNDPHALLVSMDSVVANSVDIRTLELVSILELVNFNRSN